MCTLNNEDGLCFPCFGNRPKFWGQGRWNRGWGKRVSKRRQPWNQTAETISVLASSAGTPRKGGGGKEAQTHTSVTVGGSKFKYQF